MADRFTAATYASRKALMAGNEQQFHYYRGMADAFSGVLRASGVPPETVQAVLRTADEATEAALAYRKEGPQEELEDLILELL